MSELPRGWTFATLNDLIASDGVFRDGDWVETKDQDPQGNVRLTQLADVGEGVFRDRSKRFLREDQAAALKCTFLEPGDVLVARMPDPLGRACVFPRLPRPAVTAVDVCIVRPGSGSVDPKWLMWTINAPQFRAWVADFQTGTTRRRISRRNLARIEFPLPPLNEQRRIVAAVEDHLSRLDAADASLAAALRRLDGLRAASLAAAVNGSWPEKPLGELILSLRNGVFVSRPAADPPGTAIFRISAVRPLELNVDDVRYAPLDAPDYLVSEGDLLFTRYSGNPDLVGACALVPRLPRPTLHPDKLIRVVVDRSKVEPAFVQIACATGRSRDEIRTRRKTTAGQVGIAGGQLKSVPVPVPPLEEQRRIVAEVEERLSRIEAMRASIERAQRRSAALRAAILERAFRGELVPQDPADEPAGALLARIRADRGAKTANSS